MKKVALFTANTQGGIIQFTLQIYETLKKNGIDTKVFLPSDVKGSDLSVIADDDLCKYDKVKAVFDKRPYRVTANEIMHLSPDAVFYMDNSPVSQKSIYGGCKQTVLQKSDLVRSAVKGKP